jgi:hypothetical protein
MNCKKCGKLLVKVDRREEMAEFDEDATEGQMADYFAAEESGDNGAWNIAIVEYECRRCNVIYQIQEEDLKSYRDLIVSWHSKAGSEDDYFSQFVFEYLAFIAHLKNNLFYDAPKDRGAIQRLKQDQGRAAWYLKLVVSNKHLAAAWKSVVHELNERPLHNSSHDLDNPEIDKWWNSETHEPKKDDRAQKGVVHGMDDWGNMVEFWHSVRNNLFHGGKNPNIERDRFLVEHAFKTLRAFVEVEVQTLISPGA